MYTITYSFNQFKSLKNKSYEKSDFTFDCFADYFQLPAVRKSQLVRMKQCTVRIFPYGMAGLIKKEGSFLADWSLIGKVYRCGADSATTITFDKDANFGGKPVKAGTYTLFVIPNEQSWTIILNGQLGQWGAFDYDKYKNQDVLHVDVPVKKLDKSG